MRRPHKLSDALRVVGRPEVRVEALSRRAFVARLAAVAAAPAALTACGSDSSSDNPAEHPVPSAGEPETQPEPPRHARPPLPTNEPLLRVRVFKARGEQPSVHIGEAEQWLRVGEASLDRTDIVLRGPVHVTIGPRGFSIIDANGVRAPTEGVGALDIAPLPDAEPSLQLNEQRTLPGSLRLAARSDVDADAFDVVNVVGMEAYLPGVVAGELYDHWHLQTRAAQAIAARSFACSERAFYRDRRAYDLTNTAASQVYLGRVRHRESIEAVAMTRGVVLAWEGSLVPGYYSSCCGGLAADATDAIGSNPANDIAPLQGRAGEDVCLDAKIARWTIERPATTLTRRFIAYGRHRRRDDLANLGQLASIEVAARNEHGRPTHFAVTDISGQRVELPAVKFRSAANYSGGELDPPKQPLWSSHVDVTIRNRTAIFEGRGYGHGVGMCQYGAQTLARSGTDYQAILAWYYPGAELVKTYS